MRFFSLLLPLTMAGFLYVGCGGKEEEHANAAEHEHDHSAHAPKDTSAAEVAARQERASTNMAADDGTPRVRFLGQIQPIIANKCSPCHFPVGGKKPYLEHPLDTYRKVKAQAAKIKEQVYITRDMPEKKEMSDETRALIARWVDQGANN